MFGIRTGETKMENARVTTSEFQRAFGQWTEKAAEEPVTITKEGRDHLVVLSADEYARLTGEDIPLEGRIVAVADVFDALTHARPYKAAWSTDESVAEIRKQSGQHFDPHVVEAFLSVLTQILEASQGDSRSRILRLDAPTVQTNVSR